MEVTNRLVTNPLEECIEERIELKNKQLSMPKISFSYRRADFAQQSRILQIPQSCHSCGNELKD